MEKRKKRRYRKQLTVVFGQTTCNHVGLTDDVSESGLLLRASRIYPPGTGIFIDLSGSAFNQQKVRCKGVVQWAKRVPPRMVHMVKNGMGVIFTEVPPEYGQFIRQLDFGRGSLDAEVAPLMRKEA